MDWNIQTQPRSLVILGAFAQRLTFTLFRVEYPLELNSKFDRCHL